MRWIASALLCCAVWTAVPAAHALPQSADKFIEALEIMGYSCKKEMTDEDGLVVATHKTHLNFLFYEGGNGVAFGATFTVKPEYKNNLGPLMEAANGSMEDDVWLPQLYTYVNKDGDLILRMQAWMPDMYEKKAFSDFMQRWQTDTLAAAQKLSKFLK